MSKFRKRQQRAIVDSSGMWGATVAPHGRDGLIITFALSDGEVIDATAPDALRDELRALLAAALADDPRYEPST